MVEAKEKEDIRELATKLKELDPWDLMLVKNSVDTLHAREMLSKQREQQLVQQ